MSTPNPISTFKRKYPRRIFTNAVGVLHKGQYSVTKGVSLGEGGMAYLWPNAIPLSGGVVITFKIPGDEMLAVRAEIRNVMPYDADPNYFFIGVQFLPLPIGEKRRIRAYVSSRAETEPII
jgi:hypothetical protein